MNRNDRAFALTAMAQRNSLGLLAAILLSLWAVTPAFAVAPPADSPRTQQAAPAPRGGAVLPFDLMDPARIETGRKRFAKTCAGYCHGHEGIGGRAPDFKGRTDLSAEEAFKTISEGRQTADVMPPWGEAFSEEQIWELVAYLKHLGRQSVD
ncbi:c-type cytochrome [Parazoarcus communis]|nr:cytochrome c [Parazoarcus communis]